MKFNKPFALEFYSNVVEIFITFNEEITTYSIWQHRGWLENPEDIGDSSEGFEGIRGIKVIQNLPWVNKYTEIALVRLEVLQQHCLPKKTKIIEIY
jgi:hypothetical protein